jgi:phage baseplate assembly protein W
LGSLADIESPVWGISTIGYGVIVEGLAAIRQRIDISIRTTRGTDPLRPEFGTFVFKYTDQPINIAVPNVKKEILDALEIWMPEIKVLKIVALFERDLSAPLFQITYSIIDETITDKIDFDLINSVTTTDSVNELVLQAFFPENISNNRFQINLKYNEADLNPFPPKNGFATIKELFDWAVLNWSYIGKWHLSPDRILCYINATGVQSASLSINILTDIIIEAIFPPLKIEEAFLIDFKVNGSNVVPAVPHTMNTPSQVLGFMQTNYSNIAQWLIEYQLQDGSGVFSDEFSDEFGALFSGYKLIGAAIDSANIQTASLTISIFK